MTESSSTNAPRSAQSGIADALSDLTDQTRILVRSEVDAAQRETLAKLKAHLPVAGLLGATGLLGVLSAASSYRLCLRLLEKVLPPATAALVATVAYGGAAGASGVVAVRMLRELPAPFPTETAKDASAAVADTASEYGDRRSDAAPA